MGAAAQIDEIPLAVDGNRLSGRKFVDHFNFIGFAALLEQFEGIGAINFVSLNRKTAFGELRHALFDFLEVFGNKRAI